MSVVNTIKPTEHVFIAGMTGCGKSVLAEVFLAGYESVIKLDTKGEVHERRRDGLSAWRGLVEGEDFTVVEHLADLDKAETGKIIFAPVWEENNEDTYNELCKYVFLQGDTILWIDELMTVCKNSFAMPDYMRAILTAGRSRGAVLWMLTQRPSGIPALCIASSTHFFVFTLPQPQDRKKMVDVTSCPMLMDKPKKYVFWYFKEGMDEDGARMATLKL